MNTFLQRADQIALTLYLVSVTCSIAGMEMFSGLVALTVLITALFRKKLGIEMPSWRTDIDIPLLGFWAWVGICLFIIPDINPDHRLDVWGSLRWIALFYVIRISIVQNYEYLHKFSKFFTFLAFFISVYSVFQFQTGFDLLRFNEPTPIGYWRARGFFGSVMSFSYVFGMIFFFFAAKALLAQRFFSRGNLWPLLVTFTMTWALLGTYTRGVWLALFGGLLAILALAKREFLLPLVLAIALIGGASYFTSTNVQNRFQTFTSFEKENESNWERLNLWHANWELFKEKPITGVGFRQNSSHIPRQYKKLGIDSTFFSHAHNNFLAVLAGTGILGFIFFLAFNTKIALVSIHLFRHSPSVFSKTIGLGAFGSQISYHIGGLTEATFYDGETMHAFASIAALLFATKYIDQRNNS